MPHPVVQYFWPVVITLCALCVVWSIVVNLRKEKREATKPLQDKKFQRAVELYHGGKYNSALRELRELLPLREQLLGAEDGETLDVRMGLGAVLQAKGCFREARDELVIVLAAQTRIHGECHDETVIALINLTGAMICCGDSGEAEKRILHALHALEASPEAQPLFVLGLRLHLALALVGQKRFAQALAGLEPCRAELDAIPAEDDTLHWSCRINIAAVKLKLGRLAEAEVEARTLSKTIGNAQGHLQRRGLCADLVLAEALAGQGRTAEAEPLHRDVLQQRERMLGSSHPDTLAALHGLAECLQKSGHVEEARALAERAHEGRREALGEQHPDTRESAELVKALA